MIRGLDQQHTGVASQHADQLARILGDLPEIDQDLVNHNLSPDDLADARALGITTPERNELIGKYMQMILTEMDYAVPMPMKEM